MRDRACGHGAVRVAQCPHELERGAPGEALLARPAAAQSRYVWIAAAVAGPCSELLPDQPPIRIQDDEPAPSDCDSLQFSLGDQFPGGRFAQPADLSKLGNRAGNSYVVQRPDCGQRPAVTIGHFSFFLHLENYEWSKPYASLSGCLLG